MFLVCGVAQCSAVPAVLGVLVAKSVAVAAAPNASIDQTCVNCVAVDQNDREALSLTKMLLQRVMLLLHL